jgi:anti-sigma B factor antagonist
MNDSGSLEISVEDVESDERGIVRVTPRGEIDLANADELGAVFGSTKCVTCDGLVLDLRNVPFIDSSGLRVILVAVRQLAPRFATLVDPNSAVARLFEMVDVTERLNVVADEQIAVTGFRAAASGAS